MSLFLYKNLNGYFNVDFSSFLNFYYPDDRYTFRSFDCLKLRTALVMIYTHLGAVLQVFCKCCTLYGVSGSFTQLQSLYLVFFLILYYCHYYYYYYYHHY